ncbi:M23 family metallopeptidase [Nonomuraea glycinis]|uniref:Peptidase M23 n=1 Tax=Nonomuraea glycinis TaxID=2047744 RepID=A0A918ADQ2_9ACTN|nr:M23 family metallopeptidase [Nonomuraea glycinis]MCA2182697.1 M23 family metallopeptidase [Nonomuraea glycinis]WSG69507.1 M23 family metallopeptidase [Nonomuraea glycinis]GGP16704.1 peptidase M23 [Nonomuraea glycinis]
MRKILIAGLCGVALPLVGMSAVGTASAAETEGVRAAAPTFQLPFPCNETWVGSTGSSAHTGSEIDFNGSATDGNADEGRTVVAAAAGKVVMSEYRTADGFGNVVKIRHSDGSVTLYAHLKKRHVSNGANVSQGQKIGEVGKTSAKYKMAAHLHYEQRTSSGKIVRASFNGATFGYPGQKIKSNNCGSGATPPKSTSTGSKPTGSNPYTPEQICGSGFKRVDSAALGSQGSVYLLYSAATGQNCVTTVRKSGSGKVSANAYLEVKGQKRATDAGSFQYYAGPVKAKALRTCVKWGGAIGSTKYDSLFEHCD